MPSNSKFTRDDNNNAAIRIMANDNTVTNSDSMFTTDDNGNTAVRVVFGEGSGGGGGDQHNLGWYSTPTALEEAHPTAEAGDWAIVGSTDTIWIWDTDTSAWVDSDKKGQVTSVNGQTGAVTLGINDVAPTQTDKSGYVLGTDGFVAGWVKPEIVQRSALPQASEEEVGKIYQYIGTTDANYTNGYFYECVSDGLNPVAYSWVQTNVQPSGSSLPSQTGQSGKFLTTDGTDASWSDKPLVNKATGSRSFTIGGTDTGYADIISIGAAASCTQTASVAIGGSSVGANFGVAVGFGAHSQAIRAIALGRETYATAQRAIQLGADGTNSDANTFKVANGNGNFEIMSADGTIPTARLTKVNTTVTLAAADWSSNSQTVSVASVTANNIVFVSPAPASASDYTSAGILCTSQSAGSLTFTCTATPINDIDVNIVCL